VGTRKIRGPTFNVAHITRRRVPNFGELRANFGGDTVCVAVCGEKHFSDQRREEVKMADFLAWVRDCNLGGWLCVRAGVQLAW
jgi:hypothetical protein